jgi:CDP-diacylglycerol pyrophosphatase
VPIRRRKRLHYGFAAAAAAIAVLATLGVVRALNPDQLWEIVHEKCVPNEQQHADPSPCALVDLQKGVERGYVILKDAVGDTQYLLVPTARLSGIESPALLLPEAPNYFAIAWRERGYVERAAKRALPRAAIGLAVNSANWRGQNQLHIHIDCVRPEVQSALRRRLGAVGDKWAPFPEPLAGHPYRAVRVAGEELSGVDPFVLLADGVSGARDAMGAQTLVVVGVDFEDGKPGFVILDAQSDVASGLVKGEELQDHSCALAHS